MKRLSALLALLMLLGDGSAFAANQTNPRVAPTSGGSLRVPGFLGIPWDATRDAAKRAMLAQGFTFNAGQSTGDALTFTGGQVAGSPVAVVVLEFCKEGFWNAGVVFPRGDTVGETTKTIAFFDAVQASLVAKYGQPTKKFRVFEPPYKEGDGDEKPALIVGKAHLQSFWQFDGKKDGLLLVVNRDLTVTLTYEYIVREPEIRAAEAAEKAAQAKKP